MAGGEGIPAGHSSPGVLHIGVNQSINVLSLLNKGKFTCTFKILIHKMTEGLMTSVL